LQIEYKSNGGDSIIKCIAKIMNGISFILDGVINGISNFIETNIAGLQYLIDEILNSEKRYNAECLRKESRIYLLKKQEPYIPPVIVERQSHNEETKN